ncbi:MAG TPA: ubiquinol oxidase subunit II [Caulobacteraceae bacterium]
MTSKLWRRGRIGLLPLVASMALSGCARAHFELLEPAGDIGAQERTLILLSLGIMLCVVIPVIILTLVFAWRYRASNTRATYAPNWSHSNAIEVVVWSIPCVIVLFLAVLVWNTTHKLDPYRPLDSKVKPVRVEVVAMNWKWLFIYPDYGIATVNQLPIPTNTPINFKLTSDGIMNSFFIPQLGSQVYAMAGMQTQLHLIANKPGSYAGLSSAFSGPGFSDMHFQAVAMSPDKFAAWTRQARSAPAALDGPSLALLERPSIKVPPATYGRISPGLFEGVVDQFMSGRMSQTALMTATPPCTPNGHASRRVD